MSDAPAITAARVLAESLAQRGVRYAFGIPGGEILPIIEAMAECGIDFVLTRHEASAGFMADAASQLGCAPGVCVSTLGPGVTNLVSGVAGAALDRSRVVAITGDVASDLRGIYTHQALDHQALLRPLVRASRSLTASEAWREIPLCLRHLDVGRPGPVHLNVPQDVATAAQPARFGDGPAPQLGMPAPESFAAATAMLQAARRPVLLAGASELSDATSAALTKLAVQLRVPVLTTYRAKGVIDEDSPWSAGAVGLSPVVDGDQQQWLARSDLLLTVGLDPVELHPNWLPGWPRDLPLIAVDRHPPHDLIHAAGTWLVGAVAPTLRALTELGPAHSAWTEAAVTEHRQRIDRHFDEPADSAPPLGAMGPTASLRAIQRALPDTGAQVTLDVGAHRITASHVLRCARPGTLLQSNGLSSMGFGLPAAIAAKTVRPQDAVVAVTGDMGLWMTLGELGTARERGLDLVVVYFADESLALIELKQRRCGLPHRAVTFRNPRVTELARAFGGEGVSVGTDEELAHAVGRGLSAGGLTLVEARVDARRYAEQM